MSELISIYRSSFIEQYLIKTVASNLKAIKIKLTSSLSTSWLALKCTAGIQFDQCPWLKVISAKLLVVIKTMKAKFVKMDKYIKIFFL